MHLDSGQVGLNFSLDRAMNQEWLETNGMGGYASSTSLNCHTRKYHGWLVSRVMDEIGRYLSLSKFIDELVWGEVTYPLSGDNYPGCFQQECVKWLANFTALDHPQWTFKLGAQQLTREILMVDGEDTILIRYHMVGDGQRYQLRLRPLLAMRGFHELQQENLHRQGKITVLSDGVWYQEQLGLFIQLNSPQRFVDQAWWYRNLLYVREQERGYSAQEDLFSPGVIVVEGRGDLELICSCSLGHQDGMQLATKWQHELTRRQRLPVLKSPDDWQNQLSRIGQKFITRWVGNSPNLYSAPSPISVAQVRGESGDNACCLAEQGEREWDNSENLNAINLSITAGYPWFLEWGRDAMIAMPGLTLCSGRAEIGLAILKSFAQHERRGLIPNYLGATNAIAYNTVDASLWFGWAAQQYYLKTEDLEGVARDLWPVLQRILVAYQAGTDYNIRMDSGGLLTAGDCQTNLTWMDAQVDGQPVTPRYGYPVEINALWFNFLGFMRELSRQLADPLLQELQELMDSAKVAFNRMFWRNELGYLADCVNEDGSDFALRPNQIFAVSLPYSPLSVPMAVSIVNGVKEQLLTPYGLRTLTPQDPRYIGSYSGDQPTRDRAYHNGTVWPWLLGHFTEALLRVTSDPRKASKIMNPCVTALKRHLRDSAGVGIAEVFAGDAPHSAGGCISQAWSVAEVLRMNYLLAGRLE